MNFLKQKERLKKNIEKSKSFSEGYKSASLFLTLLSYLGNVAAIYLAYFFLNKILTDVLSDLIPTFILITVSVFFLILFELLKRYLFDKVSKTLIFEKLKSFSPELFVVFGLSLCIVGASFYLTIKGAEDVADKGEKINKIETVNVNNIKDSIVKIYKPKTELLDNQINEAMESNKKINKDIELEDNTWSKNILRGEKTKNDIKIDDFKKELTAIEKERDALINTETKKIESKTTILKDENKSRTSTFIIISFFIEFLILSGIVFKNYYLKKSNDEYDEIYKNNPIYKKLELYDELLNILFKDGKLGVSDIASSGTQIASLVQSRKINVADTDLKEFIDLMSYLDILETHSNHKKIKCSYEQAKEKLQEELLNSK